MYVSAFRSDGTFNIVALFANRLAGCIVGGLLSLVFSSLAFSANQSILIISDAGSRIHAQVVKELKSQEPWRQASADYLDSGEITEQQLERRDPSLIVTLGFQAALRANRTHNTTLNALLSRRSAFDRRLCIINRCPRSGRHYTILLDQPITRQLNLLTAILPQANKIGVLTADFSADNIVELQREAEIRHLQLIDRSIDSTADLNRQFDELSRHSDVILALPDPMIHNRETIPYLLLTSYRYNIPLIGFSKAYVNAGAIAAVFSSPKQIARHIRELAERILTSAEAVEQHLFPPKYFSVGTNQNVARSLEIRLPDNEQIKLRLLSMEK